MPDTLRLSLDVTGDARDVVLSDLSDLGFDAFQETDAGLDAFVSALAWPALEESVSLLLASHDLEAETETIPDRDWNAEWEAALQPIEAGPFVVAPSWTDIPDALADREILRIDPKMAFGTGYHETTRIVLGLLAKARPRGRVLDVGTGTGVLALAALKLGADAAIGVDIDEWSVANGQENAALNGLGDRLEVRRGSLEVVPERDFDVVVANIIRSILEPLIPGLVERAAQSASVVLSGLLGTERGHMVGVLEEHGFGLEAEASENEWWGGVFRGIRD
ncbi:50S ribosomal protein L11 methyltransferase [Rubrivirga sp.]|uniref:50S ribosomal protein L11 methyltransferase n=1 Tax=Rubrivirga sp. TaxID=1885344 RepID=UPI003C72035D